MWPLKRSSCPATLRRVTVDGRFEEWRWHRWLGKSMELSEGMLVEGHYLHGAVSWVWSEFPNIRLLRAYGVHQSPNDMGTAMFPQSNRLGALIPEVSRIQCCASLGRHKKMVACLLIHTQSSTCHRCPLRETQGYSIR